MIGCASCGAPLPDGARFCPSCGHDVASAVMPSAGEARRVVTVLFADLVGYTALSEHLDPERVKRLIDASFERLIADITAFGGRIDKVLGDGILALFGAPVAHEDDADRAIRAAMQMHESLARFVAEQPDLDGPLQMRIGINTGEVVVGNVSGTAEYTAMGDTVNVASRLQSLAQPGGILIGDSTAALASPEILRDSVDSVEVRGREQAENVWRVVGRRRVSPYLFAVPAVARAVTVDSSGAIDDAARVEADARSSYLDRVLGVVAAAIAQLQMGGAEAAMAHLERAWVTANEAGDVVAREPVALIHSSVSSEATHLESEHLGVGWKVVAASPAAAVDDSGEQAL